MDAPITMIENEHPLQERLKMRLLEPSSGGVEKLISVFFSVVLKCPNPACRSSKLWKDGLDHSHSHKPQRLVCSRCGRRFYPHTSYVFHVLSQYLLAKLVDATLGNNIPLEALADQYHVSKALISSLFTLSSSPGRIHPGTDQTGKEGLGPEKIT